ncbi:hypothetical protein S7335_1286 [Synechococcus sp. PCC 7335]|nr:hypothetical protein [Synechococcus sp. PCC 7335]EDX82582.1 hypothetical protein S7335_1286 [Synechococcus sp. PCC 7335]
MFTVICLCVFISAVAITISKKDMAAAHKYMNDYDNEGISLEEVNTP